MSETTALLVIVVVTALGFDFTNGFHDTANAMATTIATAALKPRIAVGVASVLNFVGAFLSISVAATIAKGIVDQGAVTLEIIFAGLVGAILWNVLTWYLSIPSSSSHALIGGIIGSVLAAVGSSGVEWSGVVSKVAAPALIAPVVAGAAALIATRISYRLTRSAPHDTSQRGFRAGQIGSSGLVALAHGTNDAQKTMGVIVLALVAAGRLGPDAAVPTWVKISCATVIAAGTFSGGWRVIRTLGTRVTDLEPTQGFSAETASSVTILSSSYFGYPLSTTQVIAGGITGTGLGRAGGVVHWGVVGRMVVAWGLTLPAAALAGAAAYGGLRAAGGGIGGTIVVAGIASVILGVLVALSRRDPVNADNVVPPGTEAHVDPDSRRMIFASFSDYVDPTALWKILAASILVSVLVPVAFSGAILGQSRREQAAAAGHRSGTGLLLLAAGGLVCAAAIGFGVWAMLQK